MAIDISVEAFNQKFLGYCEYWDSFILKREFAVRNIWRDRLPKGVFPLYNGLVQKSNIYRGGLGPQAGLTEWYNVDVSHLPSGSNPGVNACVPRTPNEYDYAVETIQFSGYRTNWKSPVICLQDVKFTPRIREQLALITRTGLDVTASVKETFSRETYVKQAVDSGKAVIFTERGMDYLQDPSVRFSYNPFEADADGDTYIKFSSSLKLSTLNWSYLDYLRTYLADQCAEAAPGMDSGRPVFGLMIDLNDFEKFVLGTDKDLREDFRYADAKALITGFDMGLKIFRGFMLMHDSRQMRFKFSTINSDGDVVAKRVKPMKAERSATIGKVPEANPEYYRAELAIGVIFMNEVVQILVPPNDLNLGSGMVFGPAPGYNGEWKWNNEYDRVHNPDREIGFFQSRFEYFPKPLLYSSEATVFLYARCPQTWGSECEIADRVAHPDVSDGPVAISEAPAAGDFNATLRTVVLTLAKRLSVSAPGTPVTIKNDAGNNFAAVIADSSMAPTYTFAWANGATNAPSAVGDINDTTVVTVTVA